VINGGRSRHDDVENLLIAFLTGRKALSGSKREPGVAA
jgi:hypothetical protein